MSTNIVDIPAGGLITRKPEEITLLLNSLQTTAQSLRSVVGRDGLTFVSQLVYVDPNHRYIEMAPSSSRAADAALLSRPHANFVSASGSWHIEFAAAEPRLAELGDKPTITLNFPSVIVGQERRRVEPRAAGDALGALNCLADTHGVAPFEASIVDISSRGIGFLLYHPDISLEPGTVLRGCRIQPRGASPITVDMEVRYSASVDMGGGRMARRSGCVFLNPNREVSELITSFNPVENPA